MIRFLPVIALIPLLSLIGCLEGEAAPRDQEQFQRQIEQQLEDLDVSISRLANRAQSLPADSRAEMMQRIRELDSRRDDFAQRFGETGVVIPNEWQQFKSNIQQAAEALRRDYEELELDLRNRTSR